MLLLEETCFNSHDCSSAQLHPKRTIARFISFISLNFPKNKTVLLKQAVSTRTVWEDVNTKEREEEREQKSRDAHVLTKGKINMFLSYI